MHIHDLINEELLLDEIAGGFIRVQTHADYGFRIYNYSEKAMFEKRWNDATEQCRGLITDVDGTILARPWRKFFNYGERGLLISSNDPVEITDKLDGSLGIAYPVGGEHWAVATRGSFASDQAVFATQWLTRHSRMWVPQREFTALFEIIYPENRIVLDYGHFKGLVLLGAVDIVHGNVYGPREAVGIFDWAGESAAVFPEKTIAEYMSGPNAHRSNAEGVVVRAGRKMIKIKQESYVSLHKLITGLSQRSVWEALGQGQTLEEVCAPLPDEFHDWVRGVYDVLINQLLDLEEKVYLEYDRIGLNLLHNGGQADRAAFAKLACQSPYRAWLFLLYDGKYESVKTSMWNSLKPSADRRWGNSGD